MEKRIELNEEAPFCVQRSVSVTLSPKGCNYIYYTNAHFSLLDYSTVNFSIASSVPPQYKNHASEAYPRTTSDI
jgi:hypothetical protein